MRLEGLPDKKKPVDCSRCFNSVTDGMKLLSIRGAAVSAGDYGAINLWIDDNGKPRGELMRHCTTINEYAGTTKSGLREWLKGNFHEMGR